MLVPRLSEPATRWPEPGTPADIAETKSLQEQVRDSAYRERMNLLRTGTEEGYFKNTRQRTPKSELARKVSVPNDEDWMPILRESLKLAMRKKTGN